MKYKLLKLLLSGSLLLTLGGCSLFRFSVDTGNPPLSTEEVNVRTMTRGFYYDLSDEITRTADSIVSTAPDISVRIRAIRWKMQSTRAAVAAAMQSTPDVALLDTWLLCVRMDSAFCRLPDSLLFREQTPLARTVAARLSKKAGRLAANLLPEEKYRLMERFVAEYMTANPVTASQFTPVNTTLPWIEFLRANGVEPQYNVGSVSDVIADLGDRFGGQSAQTVNSITWSKDIFEMRLAQDSLHLQIGMQLDSLERNFTRMVMVAEHLPEISDRMLAELNARATQLISTMEASVDHAFSDLDRQRTELQYYVSRERETLVEQLRAAGDDLVRTTLDAVPGVIGQLLFYFVLAVAVLVGGPFALGFWLGGVRARARMKKRAGE